MKKVWVNGVFDVLHLGHIELFKYSKSLGNTLMVGIDSDERVKKLKGHLRPINSQNARREFLRAIVYIDDVCIFNSADDLRNAIKNYNPDVMVVGGDYRNKEVIGSEFCENVQYFDRIGEYSSTNILEKMRIE